MRRWSRKARGGTSRKGEMMPKWKQDGALGIRHWVAKEGD